MASNESVSYRGYLIYPLAIQDAAGGHWRTGVMISPDTGDHNRTMPRSQALPPSPETFADQQAAIAFALQQGRAAVDRTHGDAGNSTSGG